MTHRIWTDTPVLLDPEIEVSSRQDQNRWEGAVYPIGNGRLGGTVFGDPRTERIQFNQDSLWVGNEDNTGGYQPFGDVYVELGATGGEYTDYRRELDLDRAVQSVSYRSGGVTYRREFFASYPAQVIVARFGVDRPGGLSGVVRMGSVHDVPIRAEGTTLVMAGDTGNFWWWQRILSEPKRLIADREYSSDQNIDLDFEARVQVLHEGGQIETRGDTAVFRNCDSVTLLLAADTNYLADRSRGWRGEHPHERVCAYLAAAAQRSYADLLAEHIADYQGLYRRVSLELADGPVELDKLSTPERVQAYRHRLISGEPPVDRNLEVLLYHYARYLMIGSSRNGHGGLPANLQGIWLVNKHPAWRCDFHTDINIQMNYWFVDAANLGECFLPLARWIDSIREVRNEETRRVLGVTRGWLMRSENGIFGGSTWHFQKGDSAWLSLNLWDHYLYTLDRNYLQRYAYPVMKEIAEFWLDHLKELPDGTLVAPEGRSPEHGPTGVDGVTYDQALCWELFTNTIDATTTLGVDTELRELLIEKRAKLLGPQVGRWGQLQEWMEDIDDPEDDHRHINHLIGVYPGYRISPETTPEFAKAAMIGLMARRDHGQGHPAWSRVWKACMFARLHDGESAFGQISETLGTHVFDNLWTVHPPFQIDANFGYAAAVNEMIVQSHLNPGQTAANTIARSRQTSPEVATHTQESLPRIHLLPALPEAWNTGRVTGLRARGGFELDLEWKSGRLITAEIRNVAGHATACTVRYGGQTRTVAIAPGAAETLTADSF